MMKLSFIAAATAFALTFTACKKDNNNGGQIAYKVKALNFSAPLASSNSSITVNSASGITWTSGSMIVSEIDFEAEKEGVEIEYELKQVSNINLFNESPMLGAMTIPDGTYKEVEVELEVKKTTSGTAPLILKGEYTDANAVKTPVEFYFNEDFEIETEAEDIVISSQNFTGLINLQLNKLLTNVTASDLSNASKVNGKIIINSTTNTTLYNKIKANLNSIGNCDFD